LSHKRARMTRKPDKPFAKIDVILARQEQESVLANLLQLYAHDFSEFHDIDIGADGRFVYKNLPLYWSEPDRHAFLVWADGNLAGFALVKRGSEISGDEGVWDMAEFFILRRYRRRGAGSAVAREIWKRFTGRWEVRVMQSNVAATEFWFRVIDGFARKSVSPQLVQIEGGFWNVFSFESQS
jgi:predicted acetyltransferase